MKYSIVIILIFGWLHGLAQYTKECYDKTGKKTSCDSSTWYRVGKKNKQGNFYDSVKTYYAQSARLRSVAIYNQFGQPTGNFASWYDNGQLKTKGRYEHRHPKQVTSSNDSAEFSLEQFFDSLGGVQVNHGNGLVHGRLEELYCIGRVVNGLRDSVWTYFYNNNKVMCHESWHEGELVDGISYDETAREYYYKDMIVPPKPRIGINEFYKSMADAITYPKDAERRGIEGTIVIEMLVSKEGIVTSPRVVQGLGFGCDEEALKAVGSAASWEPALLRGQPVQHIVKIPFVFKLK